MPTAGDTTSLFMGQMYDLRRSVIELVDQSLPSFLNPLQNRIQELENETALKRSLEEENSELRREVQSLRSQVQRVNGQNATLKQDIIELGNSLNPTQDEGHYVKLLTTLNGKIENGAANKTPGGSIGDGVIKETWEKLRYLKDAGGTDQNPYIGTLEIFSSWYKDGSNRVQLIRHCIAAQVYKHILRPFIFGMKPEVSDALLLVAGDIMKGTHVWFSC
jgi:hypothetical protein